MNSQTDKEGSGHVKAAVIGGVFALLAACVGGLFLIFNTMVENGVVVVIPSSQATTAVSLQPSTISSNPASIAIDQPTEISQDSPVKYDGWIICWHGRDGYEYLIGYPESDARQGISLVFKVTNAQGDQAEVANDSLKMCYMNGEWYGRPDPNDWFPTVSYLTLLDGELQVCSDSPCQTDKWTLLPQKYLAWNAPELEAPREAGIHIIAYKPTR